MDILEMERKGCFDYFWNEVCLETGLVRDNSCDSEEMKNIASIASVGFALTAIAIGVEHQYIRVEEGRKRCALTLDTLLHKLPHRHGFFYHFMDMKSGEPRWNQEVSIIDTSIALMGVLSVGEYFGGEIQAMAQEIYERVDWNFYVNPENETFYMGYNEHGGFGSWNMYAEQLMVYFLAVASPTHPVSITLYDNFRRDIGSYKGEDFIYTPIGSIFPYQFSHAFLDFRDKKDQHGVDWFTNSIHASIANRQYCIDHKDVYKTYHASAWGLTACQSHHGYDGDQGTLPSNQGNAHHADGTVPPCGSIGSIVFTPEASIQAMNYYYEHHGQQLWGRYGFHDAYNSDCEPAWYCPFEIGIDKGISLLMMENYECHFVWNLMNKSKVIQTAFELLQFQHV